MLENMYEISIVSMLLANRVSWEWFNHHAHRTNYNWQEVDQQTSPNFLLAEFLAFWYQVSAHQSIQPECSLQLEVSKSKTKNQFQRQGSFGKQQGDPNYRQRNTQILQRPNNNQTNQQVGQSNHQPPYSPGTNRKVISAHEIGNPFRSDEQRRMFEDAREIDAFIQNEHWLDEQRAQVNATANTAQKIIWMRACLHKRNHHLITFRSRLKIMRLTPTVCRLTGTLCHWVGWIWTNADRTTKITTRRPTQDRPIEPCNSKSRCLISTRSTTIRTERHLTRAWAKIRIVTDSSVR